ncbi:unnamed protein product [Lactuca saligna]|uniref:Uncharacterized protein n=1 Tax=Lactuca saligna TaxID=75948 RepID=A0AA35VAI2_LACSI|nr:unnamed protein product [Lactuca saligna]
MEVALKDGLEKFFDSVVLKEWTEKMNELFREVHEGANNKKVNELEGYNELNMNDMVDGGGGNSSPIKGLVYRRKKLISGFSGDYLVGRNLGEAVDNTAEDVDNE